MQIDLELKNLTTSATDRPVRIVRREEIPMLTSVLIDGVAHNLGVLKDFRKHPALCDFVPEAARPSLAWVHLEPGEVLAAHRHPIDTMIIVCHGSGALVGDVEAELHEGDVVAIPAGRLHGFVGGAGIGHWALSIQFEGRGLYEDPAQGRVEFGAPGSEGLPRLLERNGALAEAHKMNPLFQLIRSPRIAERACRARLLDCIQVWSSCFLKVLLARSTFTEASSFRRLFERHLAEEYSHSADLARDRGPAGRDVWDATLEATCHWFVWKMMTLDAPARTVLVHLVLEVGSSTFHEIANPLLSPYGETNYFAAHDEADQQHRHVGVDLLEDLDAATYRRLERVQSEGWQMLETLCARMAELAIDG